MAYYNKKFYNKKSQQQQKTSFACNRKFYSLCSHRLGEGVGLVGLYDKLKPVNNIEQGNIESICLSMLKDQLVWIPDNKDEILATKIRIFVPDSLSYLLNGDIADFVFNSVRINGEEISPDLLSLMDEVDTMLREKSRNINIRLYQYQPQELKLEAQTWFQGLVDSYLNGLKSANQQPAPATPVLSPLEAKKLEYLEKAEAALLAKDMETYQAYRNLASDLEEEVEA